MAPARCITFLVSWHYPSVGKGTMKALSHAYISVCIVAIGTQEDMYKGQNTIQRMQDLSTLSRDK